MPPRIWLIIGILIVVCGIPCSAQRIGSFGSRTGGFGRGPAVTHMGSGGFSRGGGFSRFPVRPPAFSGFRRSQPVPYMRGFRGWPGDQHYSRSEAMAPLQIDLEGVGKVPARELAGPRVDAGFLADLAGRSGFERLVGPVERARHRLPVAGAARTLQQQDFQIDRVDHDENRDRQLVAHAS